MKYGFNEGILTEDDIENLDETHLVFNMDDGKMLGLDCSNTVQYTDLFPGGKKITAMVRLSGGANATIHVPFLICNKQKPS